VCRFRTWRNAATIFLHDRENCAILTLCLWLGVSMGILDNRSPLVDACDELRMLDWAGVPEHYVTKVWRTEDAGGECVRAYLIAEMGNLLIPRYTFVMPARNIAAATMTVQTAALEIYRPACRAH
jgi:hypothetical protein